MCTLAWVHTYTHTCIPVDKLYIHKHACMSAHTHTQRYPNAHKYFRRNACLLLASMRRSLGVKSEDDSCSFTLEISLGCRMSNKLCPIKSDCKK